MKFEEMVSYIGLSKEESRVFVKVLWRVWLIVFSLLAFGRLSFLGIPGFVSATELEIKLKPYIYATSQQTLAINQLSQDSKEQTLQLLRIGLMDLQLKWCRAPHGELKNQYFQRINEGQTRFKNLTGDIFPVPSCADL